MQLLRRWQSLPALDRRLLLEAVALVLGVRLGLWLLPFPSLRRLLARAGNRRAAARDVMPSARRIALAVGVASRYVPAATCLTQALAAQALLERHGHAAECRIGVAKAGAAGLQAHAWVTSGGQVLIGNTGDLSRFSVLSRTGAIQS